jgi:hypothetical protein
MRELCGFCALLRVCSGVAPSLYAQHILPHEQPLPAAGADRGELATSLHESHRIGAHSELARYQTCLEKFLCYSLPCSCL